MSETTKYLVALNGKYVKTLEDYDIRNEFPKGNYELISTPGGIILEKKPEIIIPEKVYSNDKEFIDHVLNTWESTDLSLGVILCGKKGLGKSFTSNIIAKKTNLPVFYLTKNSLSPDLFGFLTQLNFPFVLFCDEFEKILPKSNVDDNDNVIKGLNQEDFLSFLDGGAKSKSKILFIATSNNEYKISEFLLNRPTRIRYYKKYETLDIKVIKEIINDLMVNKNYEEDLLLNIPYTEINVDALIKIIEEINIHNKPYSSFKEFFNFNEDVKELYYLEGITVKLDSTYKFSLPAQKNKIIGVIDNCRFRIKETIMIEENIDKIIIAYDEDSNKEFQFKLKKEELSLKHLF